MAISPPWAGATFWGRWRNPFTGSYDGGRMHFGDVHAAFPTITGASVDLPANTIYIRPSDGRVFRTV